MSTKKPNKKQKKNNPGKPFIDLNSTLPIQEQCAHKYYADGLLTGILVGWGITITALLTIDMIKNKNY